MDYQGNSSIYLGPTQTYMEWIQSITWQTWLIVALILAILGFNIFYYLAKGTEDIHRMFSPILNLFGKTVVGTTQQAINTAAVGVSGTTHVLNNGLEQPVIQNAINPLANVINTAGITTVSDNATYTSNLQDQNNDIEAVQASSSIHKEGWCYIGEEQGYRSCAQVGVNDQCMSGDIFPTKDICVNPNLRQ